MTVVSPIEGPARLPPQRIRRVPPERRLEALQRLLGREKSQAVRFMEYAREQAMPLDRLWGAFDDRDRVVAAAMLSPNPGRTAMLLASIPTDEEHSRCVTGAVTAALSDTEELDLALVQCLVDPRSHLELSTLLAAGLRRLATLSYLERAVPRLRPPAPPLPTGITIAHWEPTERAMLEDLLQATYVDTLDCPGLAGIRSGHDILEGHRRGGRFEPSLWSILRDSGRAVGALLMNATPALGCVEIVYLGLIPEARGRGLGRILLDHAFRLAAHRPERSMVLAVDEENAPALRLYEAAGFRRTLRRIALIHAVNSDT